MGVLNLLMLLYIFIIIFVLRFKKKIFLLIFLWGVYVKLLTNLEAVYCTSMQPALVEYSRRISAVLAEYWHLVLRQHAASARQYSASTPPVLRKYWKPVYWFRVSGQLDKRF